MNIILVSNMIMEPLTKIHTEPFSKIWWLVHQKINQISAFGFIFWVVILNEYSQRTIDWRVWFFVTKFSGLDFRDDRIELFYIEVNLVETNFCIVGLYQVNHIEL